jgi:hypothetical protein
VGNDQNILFLEDVWNSNIPLKLEFLGLYVISKDTGVLVKDYWEGNGWNISFRRPLGRDDVLEWGRLIDMLDDFSLNEGEYSYIWILEKSQKYSTESM